MIAEAINRRGSLVTDERVKLALLAAPPKMRKTVLEFAARGFRLISVHVFYDTGGEFGKEVVIEFRDPADNDGDGFTYVIRQDGSVREE